MKQEKDINVQSIMERVSIILVRPKYPENIGAAVRAAYNMGICRISIVGQMDYDLDTVSKVATHNAAGIVKEIVYYDHLDDALEDCTVVIGTTARFGRKRATLTRPCQVVEKIVQHFLKGRVGLLFGPENQGLTNEELKDCGVITTIPTSVFSSINLGQAVAIMSYEMYKGAHALSRAKEQLQSPRLASIREQHSVFEPVDEVCQELDGILGRDKAKNRKIFLRKLLGGSGMKARDAKLMKGFFKDISKALSNYSA